MTAIPATKTSSRPSRWASAVEEHFDRLRVAGGHRRPGHGAFLDHS